MSNIYKWLERDTTACTNNAILPTGSESPQVNDAYRSVPKLFAMRWPRLPKAISFLNTPIPPMPPIPPPPLLALFLTTGGGSALSASSPMPSSPAWMSFSGSVTSLCAARKETKLGDAVGNRPSLLRDGAGRNDRDVLGRVEASSSRGSSLAEEANEELP